MSLVSETIGVAKAVAAQSAMEMNEKRMAIKVFGMSE